MRRPQLHGREEAARRGTAEEEEQQRGREEGPGWGALGGGRRVQASSLKERD